MDKNVISERGEKFKDLKTIQKRRLYEEIVDQVQELIDDGRLQLGDKLPTERELATTFGVSRHSVREALRTLEHQCVIKSVPGSGTFVAAQDPDSVIKFLANSIISEKDKLADIFEFRQMVEPKIAYLAALNAKENDVFDLKNNIEKQQFLMDHVSEYIRLDSEFHFLLAKASGNIVLIRITERMNDILSECRDEMFYRDKQRIQKSIEGHRNIFKAIENKDPNEAYMLMSGHLGDMEKYVLKDAQR